jgi:ABC-type multidrug transport system fused ATPase/permease subunit
MLQVTLAFAFLARLFTELMQAIGASTRIFALMDQKSTIPSTADVNCSIEPQDFVGHVRFDHVYFTYPSRPEEEVLTDISFSIESGQKVALVGPSGSGKSTIASLIERFYDPKSGRIYFGSDLLSSINPQWIRQNLSFVNQELSLFSCSIRDNITFGFNRNEISLDQIIEVSKQANAHEFIEQLENQYDTLVGERGICLSGEQKQRLASKLSFKYRSIPIIQLPEHY